MPKDLPGFSRAKLPGRSKAEEGEEEEEEEEKQEVGKEVARMCLVEEQRSTDVGLDCSQIDEALEEVDAMDWMADVVLRSEWEEETKEQINITLATHEGEETGVERM